jgi:hypothetical protein
MWADDGVVTGGHTVSTKFLIVFDTCTIPEYYDDVHKILAYPAGFVVKYDYQVNHIEAAAVEILDRLVGHKTNDEPVVLAYVQARDYKKGGSPPPDNLLPDNALCTLTRIAKFVAVRKVTQDRSDRYYLDLELGGYPFDRDQQLAKDILTELRKKNAIPMLQYIATSEDTGVANLVASQVPSDQSFPAVVNALGQKDSQFSSDTFWRVFSITDTTKSLVPFKSLPPRSARLSQEATSNRVTTYIRCVDQSILEFELQLHRARESDTKDYRIREIHVDSSPATISGKFLDAISTRSYGRSVITLPVPATSSLSDSTARFLFKTVFMKKMRKRIFHMDLNCRSWFDTESVVGEYF